jgi:hypothetical protein
MISIVAPDGHLAQSLRFYGAESVRFTSFENAAAKTEPNKILLIQWSVAEIIERLKTSEKLERPFIVYCPELPLRTVKEGEEIRFALLQLGAAAVFSQIRQLPDILPLLQ